MTSECGWLGKRRARSIRRAGYEYVVEGQTSRKGKTRGSMTSFQRCGETRQCRSELLLPILLIRSSSDPCNVIDMLYFAHLNSVKSTEKVTKHLIERSSRATEFYRSRDQRGRSLGQAIWSVSCEERIDAAGGHAESM